MSSGYHRYLKRLKLSSLRFSTFNRVFLHRNKETAGHLWSRSSGVEQSGRGVSKILHAHEVVGLEGSVDVIAVNADGDTHEHMLWSLDSLAIDLHQIRSLQSLEAEVVVLVVSIMDDRAVQLVLKR